MHIRTRGFAFRADAQTRTRDVFQALELVKRPQLAADHVAHGFIGQFAFTRQFDQRTLQGGAGLFEFLRDFAGDDEQFFRRRTEPLGRRIGVDRNIGQSGFVDIAHGGGETLAFALAHGAQRFDLLCNGFRGGQSGTGQQMTNVAGALFGLVERNRRHFRMGARHIGQLVRTDRQLFHDAGQRGFAGADRSTELAFEAGEGARRFVDIAHLLGNRAGGLTQDIDMLRDTLGRMVRLPIDEAQSLLDIVHAGLQHAFKLHKAVVGAHHHIAERGGEFRNAVEQRLARLGQGFDNLTELADGFGGAVFDNIAQAFGGIGGSDQHGFAVLADLAGHAAAFLAQQIEHSRALIAQFLRDMVAVIAQTLGHAVGLLLQVLGDDLALHDDFHGHRLTLIADARGDDFALCADFLHEALTLGFELARHALALNTDALGDGIALIFEALCHGQTVIAQAFGQREALVAQGLRDAGAVIAEGGGDILRLRFDAAQNAFGHTGQLAIGVFAGLGDGEGDDFAIGADLLHQFRAAPVEYRCNFLDLVTKRRADHFGAHIEGFDQRAAALVDCIDKTATALVDGGDE